MPTVYVAVDVQNLENGSDDHGQVIPIGALLDRVRAEGYPVVLRAYADWTESGIRERMPEYRAHGFELVQLMSDSRGKNTADIMLALDVMESLHLPDCPDVFVVISGDGDFVPLSPKLRRKLKQFIAMGFRDGSSTHLQRLADQFIYFEDLVADYEARRRTVPPTPQSEQAPAACPAAEEQPPAETVAASAEPVPDTPEPQVTRIVAETIQPQTVEPDYPQIAEPDFSNPRESALYYRRVLQEFKHVRVESFYHRRKLVNRAWEYLQDRGVYVALQDIYDDLRDYADYNSFGIYPKGIEVILRTLYIARCFDLDGDVQGFDLRMRVYPGTGVDADTALDLMNLTYVRGITLAVPDIHLDVGGLAVLLMDEDTPETREKAADIVQRIRPFQDTPTAIGQAMFDAIEEARGKQTEGNSDGGLDKPESGG